MDTKCKHCKAWRPHAVPSFGWCKKYAPRPAIVKGEEGENFILVWPSTGADDECEEFDAYVKIVDDRDAVSEQPG